MISFSNNPFIIDYPSLIKKKHFFYVESYQHPKFKGALFHCAFFLDSYFVFSHFLSLSIFLFSKYIYLSLSLVYAGQFSHFIIKLQYAKIKWNFAHLDSTCVCALVCVLCVFVCICVCVSLCECFKVCTTHICTTYIVIISIS